MEGRREGEESSFKQGKNPSKSCYGQGHLMGANPQCRQVWGETEYLSDLEISSSKYLLLTKRKTVIFQWSCWKTTLSKWSAAMCMGAKYGWYDDALGRAHLLGGNIPNGASPQSIPSAFLNLFKLHFG